MKLLIDTNFILDVILERQPFYSNSVKVLSLAKKEDVEEYISASAVTDVSYLLYRQLKDKGRAKELLREFFEIVSVAGNERNCDPQSKWLWRVGNFSLASGKGFGTNKLAGNLEN